MRPQSGFGKKFMLASVLMLATLMPSVTKAFEDYKFKVHNNTKVRIKQILVSEDGKNWGFFDIGKGIAAGATVDLVWGSNTNNAGCEWYFKAVG